MQSCKLKSKKNHQLIKKRNPKNLSQKGERHNKLLQADAKLQVEAKKEEAVAEKWQQEEFLLLHTIKKKKVDDNLRGLQSY